MPRWVQITLHGMLAGCNAALAFHGVIPPVAAVSISVLQAGIGAVSQSYNTDGTPQEVPYRKPE